MPFTVAGQDAAVRILNAAIAGERVAHAYVFAGPAHTGKALAAMQFAQALNCPGDSVAAPCGACRSCEKIAAGTHPDVEVVGIGAVCVDDGHDHAKDNSRDIRICQVRRIEQIVSRAPYEGRRRVIIIDPADALNVASISALLKTLEEPPTYVVFVLVTAAEEVLLDTVRSRARRVAFGGQARELIERTLRTHWNAEPEDAAELARLSGGRLGWAINAHRDSKTLDKRDEILDRCEMLAQAGLAQRFAFAGTLGSGYSRDRAGTQATLELWQEWWRDVLLVAAGRASQVVNTARLDTLRSLAAQCEVRSAVGALRAIADARQQLIENASPSLTLEAMMLALPQLKPNNVAVRLRG